MALAAVEASLYTSKTDVPLLAAGLSLEHLLPQDWQANWPLIGTDGTAPEGEALEDAIAQRWACLNRLGNLTIVTQPLNTEIGRAHV